MPHDEGNFSPPDPPPLFCEDIKCIQWEGKKCLDYKIEEDCLREYFETCDGRPDRREDE